MGGNGATRRLVIVESPTKARKLAGYLGANYIVESSRGHIRDLPRAAADVPAKYKSQPWARLGVNVDEDFEPLYIISPDKKSTVTELKGLLKDVDELYLATDGDREGEAIAWHLLETLKPRVPIKRMVFHEITEQAILEAAANPRDLDIDLVDAQETRRILDRLYGYEVSPVLWKKVAPKLSAGRVQSVATRIIVQRERDRPRFRLSGRSARRPWNGRKDHRARRGQRRFAGRRPAWIATDRRIGRRKALHPSTVSAVHDIDVAAGSRPQAAVFRRAHDEHRPAALRERLHHLHAYRLDDAVAVGDQRGPHPGPSALRRGVRPPPGAPVHPQGEERPGSPRGDPAGGGNLRHPGRGASRARRGRVPALRADLAAHSRLADGRRPRHHAQPADQRPVRRS